MSGPAAPQGLCGRCRYAPDCAVRPTLNHPVTRCERFEPLPRISPPGDGGTGANGLMGLCVNCAKRDVCTHPKLEGGVWHCDEYT